MVLNESPLCVCVFDAKGGRQVGGFFSYYNEGFLIAAELEVQLIVSLVAETIA